MTNILPVDTDFVWSLGGIIQSHLIGWFTSIFLNRLGGFDLGRLMKKVAKTDGRKYDVD